MSLAKKLFLLLLLVSTPICKARNYFIFSVMHELPMTNKSETMTKNYYVNLGAKQGVREGTVLDVYRRVVQNDPYETKKRYDYDIKIGELEIIHNDKDSSIAISKSLNNKKNSPLFEIPNFMVGDAVKVKVN